MTYYNLFCLNIILNYEKCDIQNCTGPKFESVKFSVDYDFAEFIFFKLQTDYTGIHVYFLLENS